jgi:hypothetical protein
MFQTSIRCAKPALPPRRLSAWCVVTLALQEVSEGGIFAFAGVARSCHPQSKRVPNDSSTEGQT